MPSPLNKQRNHGGDQRTLAMADHRRLFLCGDMMTGRGIDQILPHPGDPKLYEPWVKSSRDYIKLAEGASGRNLREAQRPAILPVGEAARLLVFGLGSTTSGRPLAWSAEADRPGLHVIESQSHDPIRALGRQIGKFKRPGDIVILSIHWGGNWGYEIPRDQKTFAHRLVDEAGVDIVHGHSSHHVKAIEVYNERLILYGCGDFFNDYEGIGGHQEFRGDLALMYFADLDPARGKLIGLRMIPTQVRRFRVKLAAQAGALWLEALLNREGKRFRTGVKLSAGNTLTLH